MSSAYDNIPLPTIILRGNQIISFNRHCAELLKLDADKNHTLPDLFDKENRDKLQSYLSTLEKNRPQVYGPVRIKPVKNKNEQFLLTLSALPEQQVMMLLTPFSNHFSSDNSGNSLSEYSIDPEIIIQNERIVSLNRAAMEFFGIKDKKEIAGKKASDFISGSKEFGLSNELLNKKLKVNSRQPGRNIFYEVIKDKKGNLITVNIFIRKIKYNNKTAFYLHIFDLSNQVSNEQRLFQEKMQYRKLLNSLPNGIIIHHKGKIQFINQKGVEFSGYTSYLELVGKRVTELFKKERKDVLGFSTATFLEGKSATVNTGKLKILRIDGTVLPVEVEISRIQYEGKDSVLIVLKDIREKEQALQRLKEAEQRLQLLIDTSPDIICFKDGKGRWLLANKADLKLFDLENIDYYGKTDAELAEYTPFHRDALLTCMETDEISWKKGEITHTDEIIPTKHEGVKIYDVFKIPLFNPDKSRKGLIVIGRDVTRRRKYEKELKEERKRVQNYLNIAQVIMISLDRAGNITMINNMGVKILGYDNYKELLGLNWFDVSCKDLAEIKRRKSEYRRIMNNEFPDDFYIEGFIRDYKSEKRIIGWHNALLKDEQGNITGILSSGVDITENVETSKQLQLKSEQLELIVNKTPALLAYADKEVRYLYVNTAYAAFYNTTPEEMEGKKASEFIPEAYYNDIAPYIEQVLSGKEVTYENKRHNERGETIYIKATYIPHFDHEGNVDAFLAMIEDITDSKIREIELQNALQRAETNDRLKKAFLSNLSHEFRTPMNAIIGFGELLKEDPSLSDEGREQVEIITSNTWHLLDLITAIIDLSRIEAGELYPKTEIVHVNNMIKAIFNKHKNEAELRNLTLHSETPLPDSEALLISDEERIKQVFDHLISNAFKFSSKGGVSIGYTLEDEEFVFFVKDTGIGIPYNQQNAIFEHFRQVETEHTRHYGGTGVGLTISKLIVEKLGGTIWVNSEPGKGSQFYFTIPKEKQAGIKPRTGKQKAEKDPQRSSSDFEAFNGMTFLITEDEKDVQFYFKILFKKSNVELLFAENGKECLELFEANKEKIDLILMDIRLEDIHGLELTRRIKKAAPGIPVIIQTAFEQYIDQKEAIEAGADNYITKPINKNELFRKIKAVLNKEGQ